MTPFTDAEFDMLTAFVKINYGMDLTNKRFFVQARLRKLMRQNHFDRFSDYFQFVCGDLSGVAATDLINGLTVNYTLFYRESYQFDYFLSDVLPTVCEREKNHRDLRIWSAGCATGEEPYTLAMLLSDHLGNQKSLWDWQVLATDISTFALKKAVAGSYPAESAEGLKPGWLEQYFQPDPAEPDAVQIVPSLRREVIFRKHNLVGRAYAFRRKFHVIFCRNVMIYFDEPTRDLLIRRFVDCLEDGGYLFVGVSETINHRAYPLDYCIPSVYRKVGTPE